MRSLLASAARRLMRVSVVAAFFFSALARALSERRPARSSIAPPSPNQSSDEMASDAAEPTYERAAAPDPFHFIGTIRKNGRLYARIWEVPLRFEWRFAFDEARCELFVPRRIPRSVADEALGACLAVLAEEKGNAA